jgi:hypothetical protein
MSFSGREVNVLVDTGAQIETGGAAGGAGRQREFTSDALVENL